MADKIQDSAGKTLGTNVGKGLYFLGDIAESLGKGAIKGVGNIVDAAGDVGAFAVDTVTNLATGGGGTNLGSEEGFIDKANKSMGKAIDETNIIDSSFGQTKAGKGLLNIAEKAGEIFTPGLPAMAGIKIAKGMWNVFRQSPKAIKELKELRSAGNITQEAVDAIANKYKAKGVMEGAAKGLKEGVGNFSKEYKSTKEILEMLKNKTPEELGVISKNFPKFSKFMSKTKDGGYTLIGAGVVGGAMSGGDEDNMLPPDENKDVSPEELDFITKNKIIEESDGKISIDGRVFDDIKDAMESLK